MVTPGLIIRTLPPVFPKCSEQLHDGKLGTVASDIIFVKPFICELLQYLLKCALHLSSWRLKCYDNQGNVVQMLFQCNQMLFQEICASYENLMKHDHCKRTRSFSYGS